MFGFPRRRSGLGGGRHAHARLSLGRQRRPYHAQRRGTSAPGCSQPCPGFDHPQPRHLRSRLRLTVSNAATNSCTSSGNAAAIKDFRCGFGPHLPRRLFQGYQHANGGFFSRSMTPRRSRVGRLQMLPYSASSRVGFTTMLRKGQFIAKPRAIRRLRTEIEGLIDRSAYWTLLSLKEFRFSCTFIGSKSPRSAYLGMTHHSTGVTDV